MHISPIGFAVFGGLFFIGYCLGAPLLLGLLASLAFGATAWATLSSLGGSSPLIYTLFVVLLLASIAMHRHLGRDLGIVFRHTYAAWLVSALLAYAMIGAVLFPRLFAGQTSVFVASRTQGGVYEVPLSPVSANISQTGYLVLGGVTFLAFCVILLHGNGFEKLRRGFFLWCIFHTSLGLLDLCAKFGGIHDLLAPIRTASYAMLTDVDQAGFFRIAGGQSEASAFGSLSLAALAFVFTYWRRTNSRMALMLSATLFVLLLLSTSSTAYIGLAILSIPAAFSVARPLAGGHISMQDGLLLSFFAVFALLILAIAAVHPSFFDPLVKLFNVAVVDKVNSASGQERAYWNYISLKSMFDTIGLGVGLGSSRASSWPVAVLSQLGIAGAMIFALLIGTLIRGGHNARQELGAEDSAAVEGIRASALAGLISNSLISGTADPGMLFFISLAAVVITELRTSAATSSYSVPVLAVARR